MTTYTTITDTETGHKKPVTVSLLRRLRDNPIAIAEGDSGAPRILIGALERLAVGSVIRSRVDAEQTTTSVSYIAAHSFAFAQQGSITVSYDIKGVNTSNTQHRITRTRNGSTAAVYGPLNATTTYVTHSVDVSVLPGDVVSVEIHGDTTPTSYTCYARNVRFKTDGANLFPGVAAIVEGNVFL